MAAVAIVVTIISLAIGFVFFVVVMRVIQKSFKTN